MFPDEFDYDGYKFNIRKDKLPLNRQIRVLRIISRMNIGGPSIHVANLSKLINMQFFQSTLITGRTSESEGDMLYMLPPDTFVIYIPDLQREISLLKDIAAFIKILKVIYRYKPDIIHTHTAKAGTLGRLAAIFYNTFEFKRVKTVHTFHGNVLEGYFGKIKSELFLMIERALAYFTNTIIAISDTQKWELTDKYKIASSDKIKKINLGFNLDPFLNAYEFQGTLRAKHNIGNDEIIVGIIGRLVPIKNHKMFFKAAKKIITTNTQLKLKFLLIGDGELRKRLEKLSIQMGLKDHLIFHGWETNIAMVYSDLDILALTSLNEGTPVSIIEAMAAGIPVITTAVGGIKDLLGAIEARRFDQKSAFRYCERGVLCPKNDPESFADGIIHMIKNNYRKGSPRTEHAKKYVLKNYSEDYLIRNVENLYHEIMTP
jgi:glycosyltransferase involved in cell wall biosynthesis